MQNEWELNNTVGWRGNLSPPGVLATAHQTNKATDESSRSGVVS